MVGPALGCARMLGASEILGDSETQTHKHSLGMRDSPTLGCILGTILGTEVGETERDGGLLGIEEGEPDGGMLGELDGK